MKNNAVVESNFPHPVSLWVFVQLYRLYNNNNNNNNHDKVYGAVIMTKFIARVHPLHLMNADWAPVAANPRTKPIDLGCESDENWQLPSTSTIAIVIVTQLILFYRPMEGGRLNRRRHWSKGAQPVPKAVCRSSCRVKHNNPRWFDPGSSHAAVGRAK